MATILSPNRYTGRAASIRLVVIHTMEVDENDPNVAESVARRFADPARRASAHICVDTDSEVRCVEDRDTAWAAPGANAAGLQIELAGRAGQTSGDWSDVASAAILERAAQRVAIWCAAYALPVRHLSEAELAAGAAGIVGHVDVSRVYKKSDHWDPGPAFPWAAFLARVGLIMGPGPAFMPSPVPTLVKPHLVEDGDRGTRTVRVWQQVMATSVDGVISHPRSALIVADQKFLNSVVPAQSIRDLTGKSALLVDGDEGSKTIVVRQFWLYNTQAPAVLGRPARGDDFNGVAGSETTKLHQHALNAATAGSRRY